MAKKLNNYGMCGCGKVKDIDFLVCSQCWVDEFNRWAPDMAHAAKYVVDATQPHTSWPSSCERDVRIDNGTFTLKFTNGSTLHIDRESFTMTGLEKFKEALSSMKRRKEIIQTQITSGEIDQDAGLDKIIELNEEINPMERLLKDLEK